MKSIKLVLAGSVSSLVAIMALAAPWSGGVTPAGGGSSSGVTPNGPDVYCDGSAGCVAQSMRGRENKPAIVIDGGQVYMPGLPQVDAGLTYCTHFVGTRLLPVPSGDCATTTTTVTIPTPYTTPPSAASLIQINFGAGTALFDDTRQAILNFKDLGGTASPSRHLACKSALAAPHRFTVYSTMDLSQRGNNPVTEIALVGDNVSGTCDAAHPANCAIIGWGMIYNATSSSAGYYFVLEQDSSPTSQTVVNTQNQAGLGSVYPNYFQIYDDGALLHFSFGMLDEDGGLTQELGDAGPNLTGTGDNFFPISRTVNMPSGPKFVCMDIQSQGSDTHMTTIEEILSWDDR